MSSAASTEWVKTLGQSIQAQILALPASPDSRGGVIVAAKNKYRLTQDIYKS